MKTQLAALFPDDQATASMQASEDSDIVTRMIFERTALDEEQHLGWLELQLDLLQRMGEPAFISKHMSAPALDVQ